MLQSGEFYSMFVKDLSQFVSLHHLLFNEIYAFIDYSIHLYPGQSSNYHFCGSHIVHFQHSYCDVVNDVI